MSAAQKIEVSEIVAWAQRPKAKARSRTISDRQMSNAGADLERMIKAKDFSEARPLHFVALYAIAHEKVYGIAPLELGPSERMRAAAMAAQMWRKYFGADSGKMIEFMRWVWKREEGREKFRRSNNSSGGRIAWRWQFHAGFVTEFRIDVARRAEKKHK